MEDTLICRTCEQAKPTAQFSKNGDYRQTRCNSCRARSHSAGNKVAVRKRRLRVYGLTVEQYEEMFAKQGGVCIVCSRPPGARSLHVDHDHATGENRGLLCHNCNIGIGNFQDDPDLLMSAALYLVRASSPIHELIEV